MYSILIFHTYSIFVTYVSSSVVLFLLHDTTTKLLTEWQKSWTLILVYSVLILFIFSVLEIYLKSWHVTGKDSAVKKLNSLTGLTAVCYGIHQRSLKYYDESAFCNTRNLWQWFGLEHRNWVVIQCCDNQLHPKQKPVRMWLRFVQDKHFPALVMNLMCNICLVVTILHVSHARGTYSCVVSLCLQLRNLFLFLKKLFTADVHLLG